MTQRDCNKQIKKVCCGILTIFIITRLSSGKWIRLMVRTEDDKREITTAVKSHDNMEPNSNLSLFSAHNSVEVLNKLDQDSPNFAEFRNIIKWFSRNQIYSCPI